MSEPVRIELLDKDGKLKPKDKFMEEMEKMYNTLEEQEEEGNEFLSLFSPKSEIPDPEVALNKYKFIERKIYLDTAITQETGQPILEMIQFWNSEDEFNGTPVEKRIPIQVYIDSPGGQLTTAFLIADAIKGSKTPVYTIVVGTAYSGGFFISIAGHKRYGFPNSTYLYHQGSISIGGDAHKVTETIEFYSKYQLKQIKDHVLKSTKISEELYDKHTPDDWWIGAKKAKKLGIIDEIITDVNGGIYDESED